MYFYKEVDETGKVVLLLTYNQQPRITNPLVIEITQEEYHNILEDITKMNEPDPEEAEATEVDYIAALVELGVTVNEEN